jgi:DNA-directed RNA polymerase delta subunit
MEPQKKVPFDIMCLADAIENSKGQFKKAYVVLGGEGWTLREYYLSDKIGKYLKNCDQVKMISLEAFIAKANKGEL